MVVTAAIFVVWLGLLSDFSAGLDPTTTSKAGGEDTTTTRVGTTTSDNVRSSSSSTTTPNPNDWQDLDPAESDKLLQFVVGEIQKLKVEHKEFDDCQKLDLSSVLSGKKQTSKSSTKYSVTLKVQPQLKETEECQQQNATLVNMHPEICEADILEGEGGTTTGKTLLRSTCLQVEELQD